MMHLVSDLYAVMHAQMLAVLAARGNHFARYLRAIGRDIVNDHRAFCDGLMAALVENAVDLYITFHCTVPLIITAVPSTYLVAGIRPLHILHLVQSIHISASSCTPTEI